ncbi:MAG: cupin domain-containing protein [Candidatus Bathyarchaeota archaeon]|nr:MAG: cupin domain-containing protein [Candidatus Bathyarchaeota archaeon]
MNRVEVVRPAEVEIHTIPGGSRVKRFLTPDKDGSGFILGLATIDAGADHEIKVTLQGKDEAYYMLKGKLSLMCSQRELEAKEGDVVLFRSGKRYKVTNIGNEPAILLYVICPSLK